MHDENSVTDQLFSNVLPACSTLYWEDPETTGASRCGRSKFAPPAECHSGAGNKLVKSEALISVAERLGDRGRKGRAAEAPHKVFCQE